MNAARESLHLTQGPQCANRAHPDISLTKDPRNARNAQPENLLLGTVLRYVNPAKLVDLLTTKKLLISVSFASRELLLQHLVHLPVRLVQLATTPRQTGVLYVIFVRRGRTLKRVQLFVIFVLQAPSLPRPNLPRAPPAGRGPLLRVLRVPPPVQPAQQGLSRTLPELQPAVSVVQGPLQATTQLLLSVIFASRAPSALMQEVLCAHFAVQGATQAVLGVCLV